MCGYCLSLPLPSSLAMDETPPPRDLQQITLNEQPPPLMSTNELSVALTGAANLDNLLHPKDCHLLDMSWTDDIYIDTCLPFGLHSAPKLFNRMADLLAGILQQQEVTELLHYLDNFLTIGPPPMSFRCQQNLVTIKRVCTHLGVGLCQICQHNKKHNGWHVMPA